MGRFHFGQQGFADGIFVDAEFARFNRRQQHLFFTRAFLVQAPFDGGEHRRLFQHDERVFVQVIQERLVAFVGEREPRLGNLGTARDVRARRRDRRRRTADAREDPAAMEFVASDLAPRSDVEPCERIAAALRAQVEGADRFDLVAEKLNPRRRVGGGRPDVDDAAAHRIFARGRDDVGAVVAEPKQPLLHLVEPKLVARRERERRRDEGVARHHELPQRGNGNDEDPGA